jgi:predicted outer membrane protein
VALAAPSLPEAPLGAAQVLRVLAVLHRAELAEAHLAQTTSEQLDVQRLAGLLVEEHTALAARVRAVAQHAGLRPEDSEASRALEREAREGREALLPLGGSELDRVWLQRRITWQGRALAFVRAQQGAGKGSAPFAEPLAELLAEEEARLERQVQRAHAGLAALRRRPPRPLSF